MLRKTKIVATIGPAVTDVETAVRMIEAGMNVARFNFSHGTHESHHEMMELVRTASQRAGIPVALLLDTRGPEIRTGIVAGGGEIDLRVGHSLTLTTEQVPCTDTRIAISYTQLPFEVKPGNHIFVADGLIDLEVTATTADSIEVVVRNGGRIGSRKNVNVPGVRTSLPAITDKDRDDILFGIREEIDFIAESFVRKPSDVAEVQAILTEHDSPIRVIAKIEDQEGLDNVDEIIRVSSGVMVARGDLGVQLDAEQIPLAQKRIIAKCNAQAKVVITATQMLDSMIRNPNPTRAELTDVANAIFDGTDAVMLSGETAGGAYPVRAVETMARIARTVETSPEYRRSRRTVLTRAGDIQAIGEAVAQAGFSLADSIGADAIVTPTLRGNSPRALSRFRPSQPIIAATTSQTVVRQLLLYWGVYPILTSFAEDSEKMIQDALAAAMKAGYVQRNQRVVTVAGVPVYSPFPMNTIKAHFLGNILNRGQRGIGPARAGRLVRAETPEEAARRLELDGTEVLLTPALDDRYGGMVPKLAALIVEAPSQLGPARLQELNPDISVVAEVPNAMRSFEQNRIVTVAGDEKTIYEGDVTQHHIRTAT